MSVAKPEPEPKPLVIGIGNPLAGDDAAGRLAARRLAQRQQALSAGAAAGAARFDVTETDGDMAGLLPLLDGRSRVVLMDACCSGAPAGSLHRFDAATPLPASLFAVSSHGMGLAHTIELARSLGRLPRRCLVLAIEGAAFAPGMPLSPPVEAALDGLCALAENEARRSGLAEP